MLEGIHALNLVLDAMGLDFLVVLGNHENYDLIDALEAVRMAPAGSAVSSSCLDQDG